MLGAAINVAPHKLVPSLRTLRLWCPPSAVHVAVVDDRDLDIYSAYHVETVRPPREDEVGGHPQQTRYWSYWQYMRGHQTRFAYVLFMDLTDVVVQGDLFQWYVSAAAETEGKLVVGAEPIYIGKDTMFNGKWYRQCYGSYRAVQRRRVINSGVVLGPYAEMLQYVAFQAWGSCTCVGNPTPNPIPLSLSTRACPNTATPCFRTFAP